MIGIVILSVLLLVEVITVGVRIWKRNYIKKEKNVINLVELLCFVTLILTNIIQLDFRWILLFAVLLIRGIIFIITAIRKVFVKEYSLSRAILSCLLSLVLLVTVMIPAIIFPVYKPIPTSGPYEVESTSYTWEDVNRVETYQTDGSNRKVTVEFWYPKSINDDKFPLVIFSHGAFGVRSSNHSTYVELASDGYVVCSIDHTYHAFATKQTDGKLVTINKKFFHSVFGINQEDISEDEIFTITREWMDVRCKDMNFVIDTILDKEEAATDSLFCKIDVESIGIMGHSLGGATAVTVGRQRSDIDAVIDLDGTMLGEEIACENNVYTMKEEPYPVPLLCLDTTRHYEEGKRYGNQYVNHVVLENALNGKEIHFDGAEHMNFTDLPLYSPFLASLLGTGKVNSRDFIINMNELILNFYNNYLK